MKIGWDSLLPFRGSIRIRLEIHRFYCNNVCEWLLETVQNIESDDRNYKEELGICAKKGGKNLTGVER